MTAAGVQERLHQPAREALQHASGTSPPVRALRAPSAAAAAFSAGVSNHRLGSSLGFNSLATQRTLVREKVAKESAAHFLSNMSTGIETARPFSKLNTMPMLSQRNK